MLTKKLQRSRLTGTSSPQRLREYGFLLQFEALTTILNRLVTNTNTLIFLSCMCFLGNVLQIETPTCKINYALNAWYAIARTAGNKSQTQPRQALLHQKRARKLHHLHVWKLSCSKRAITAAPQAAAVIAEACTRSKARGSSAGFRSLGFRPQQGQLRTQGAKATAGPQSLPSLLTLLLHCRVLWQHLQGAPAHNPALEHKI